MNSSRAPLRRTPPRRPHAPPRPKASCLEESPVFDDDCDAPTVIREVPVVPSRPMILDAQDLEPIEDDDVERDEAVAPMPIEPAERAIEHDDRAPTTPAASPDPWRAADPLADDEPIDPRVFRSSLRARGALVACALAVVTAIVAVALTVDASSDAKTERQAEGTPLVPAWPPPSSTLR